MIRNLKFLGLALVAVLAMSATAVSVASADEFNSESSGTTTFTGAQEKHTDPISGKMVFDKFKVDGGTVECSTATYVGMQVGSALPTVRVAPTYGGCTFTGLATTIDTNGCEYEFKLIGATTTGTVSIVCPVGKEITATVVPAPGTTRCTVHIPPQNGINGVTYTNIAGGGGSTREITVAVNANNIEYSQTAGSGSGACATADNTTGGIYEGAATVTGENASGHVGIFLK